MAIEIITPKGSWHPPDYCYFLCEDGRVFTRLWLTPLSYGDMICIDATPVLAGAA